MSLTLFYFINFLLISYTINNKTKKIWKERVQLKSSDILSKQRQELNEI
jgi:hypothetical protein